MSASSGRRMAEAQASSGPEGDARTFSGKLEERIQATATGERWRDVARTLRDAAETSEDSIDRRRYGSSGSRHRHGRGQESVSGRASAYAVTVEGRATDRRHRRVQRARGGPRSRRAVGVGDVAGERRDRRRCLRGVEPWRSRCISRRATGRTTSTTGRPRVSSTTDGPSRKGRCALTCRTGSTCSTISVEPVELINAGRRTGHRDPADQRTRQAERRRDGSDLRRRSDAPRREGRVGAANTWTRDEALEAAGLSE